MTIEQQLIDHIRQHSYADLPQDAIEAARREVLWALGTALAGAGAEGAERIVAFVRQQGGREEATVIGFGDRVPAALAGLANGSFAKALEYEDKFWMDGSHGYGIGPAVVPAAFATAEHLGGVDGKTFLAAVALATDVQARLLTGMPKCFDSGWNPTYVLSVFGAVMTAAKLLDLDDEQFANAMGIAYAQLAGNRQTNAEGAYAIRMQMGFGVRNGITAAQLAKLGITGAHNFLTGPFGLYRLVYKDDEVDLVAPTRDLGRAFLGARLGFKAWPCGAVAHPVLDAVLSVRIEDGITAESIEAIHVFGTPRLRIMAVPIEVKQNPTTHIEAEFSIPWGIACVLIDGRLSLSHFEHAALTDQRYTTIARKVHVHMDAGQRDVWVEVKLSDGRVVKSPRVVAPKGHPDNPQSLEELIEKYRDCVQHGPKPLPNERTERAKDLILRLHELPDVSEAIRLLA
jgi:2-methylcitrate dehydratase PrpD